MSTIFEDLVRDGFARVVAGAPPAAREAGIAAARDLFALSVETRCDHHQPEWGGLVGYQFGDPNELYLGQEPVSEYWHLVRSRPGGFATRWPLEAARAPLEALMAAREASALAALADVERGLGSGQTLRGWVRGGYTMLRLIHYPPGPASPPPDGLRASEHVDAGLLSLYDGGTSPGLQLRTAAGGWLSVEPGAWILAAGEVLSRFSGGRIPGAVHRVVYPGALAPERLAMPFFLNPRLDQPLDDGMTYGDFLRSRTGWGPPLSARR